MKLSVVVVNHNSCLLLKHAAASIIDVCRNIDYELLIVDNASADHSLDMLAQEFPDVRIIANDIDAGVAKANNQALMQAQGEYVLLVGADTITVKDSVEKMIAFMDDHHDAGGLSIRMLDAEGRFLPRSIHGLTKPWGAFLKLIGFAGNLSKTRLYDRNRKDWTEEFKVAEIDILSGACMLLRASALNETGLFDERYFMFGHDIDLSYRLRLAGFKNYYFPKAYIINFQRQFPPKFSWNYFKYFYGAMFIFALKYLIKLPDINIRIPALLPSTYEVK